MPEIQPGISQTDHLQIGTKSQSRVRIEKEGKVLFRVHTCIFLYPQRLFGDHFIVDGLLLYLLQILQEERKLKSREEKEDGGGEFRGQPFPFTLQA